jgi:hypothetical protein
MPEQEKEVPLPLAAEEQTEREAQHPHRRRRVRAERGTSTLLPAEMSSDAQGRAGLIIVIGLPHPTVQK